MPGIESAQGATVTFDGVAIGYLTGFDWEVQAGQLAETTNVTSLVIGSGANSRVVREYDCTSMEPPTFTFTFFGPPSYSQYDAGKKGTLSFTTSSTFIEGEAILRSFNHSGRTNAYTTGSASFQFTGYIVP